MTLGELIKSKRRERDLSQAQLGELIGGNQMRVSRLENGSATLTVPEATALAAALDVPVGSIVALGARSGAA